MASIASAIDTTFTPAASDFLAQVTGGTANLMRRNSSGEAWALVDAITNRAVVVSNPVAGAQYQFTAVSPAPVVRADQ